MMIEAELFLLNLTSVDNDIAQQQSRYLSQEEQQHWQAISDPNQRKRYLYGRSLLRQLLAKRVDKPLPQLQFIKNRHGKPYLADSAWHFNLSHSGNWLALALCQHGPIGVDIECSQRTRPILALAHRFYAPSEYEWLTNQPEDKQLCAFYRLWSRKEAVLKAHGVGLSAGLEKARFLPDEQWRLDNQFDHRHYYIHDWPLAGGWLSLAATTPYVLCYKFDNYLNYYSINPMLIQTIA